MESVTQASINSIRFDERGLVPVVVHEAASGNVLMLAWANREALEHTFKSREAWFWSRSRRELWNKGATSGNRLRVLKVIADCDADAVLYVVERLGGGVCHETDETGNNRLSCFFRRLL
ncbi:MAG: phosphoribosyl-AMP cyclohydrolase [Patescibacteria group bacterium]|nr:phosphoribosyl-AMP cyclohydrolase [Patescibacteria group bacterium]